MAPRVVHLHIGSTKTGTTFIQRVLWSNKKALKANGVVLPAKGQYVFGRAARALHHWRPAEDPVPSDWMQVARAINRARTDSAIVSQEFLSWLDPEQVKETVATIEHAEVKVVLTTRDLARLIPAQWQSAMRQRNTWTLTEYSHGVQHGSDQDPKRSPYQHFWHRMDYAATLRAWSDVVGLENVTVVTVPPSGADPDELWRRFCAATELDPGQYTTAGVTNASLGALSCEVMRRLNGVKAVQDMPREEYGVEINGTLTRKVLDLRGQPEPKITLPEGEREWVVSKADEIIAGVEAVGARVIGTLDDLRPRPFTAPYQAPEDLPADDLLAVALDALGGLAVAHTSGGTAPKPGFMKPRTRPKGKATRSKGAAGSKRSNRPDDMERE
jgi:hypothetical protein